MLNDRVTGNSNNIINLLNYRPNCLLGCIQTLGTVGMGIDEERGGGGKGGGTEGKRIRDGRGRDGMGRGGVG